MQLLTVMQIKPMLSSRPNLFCKKSLCMKLKTVDSQPSFSKPIAKLVPMMWPWKLPRQFHSVVLLLTKELQLTYLEKHLMRSLALSTIHSWTTAPPQETDLVPAWTDLSSPMDSLPPQPKCKAIAWATDKLAISSLSRASYKWNKRLNLFTIIIMMIKRETIMVVIK